MPEDVPLNDEEEQELERDEHELLRLHYKLGHLPNAQFQLMAKAGDPPPAIGSLPHSQVFSLSVFQGHLQGLAD